MITLKELDEAQAKYLGLWIEVEEKAIQAQNAEQTYAEMLDEYNAHAEPSNGGR
jgi:hypothetical protein